MSGASSEESREPIRTSLRGAALLHEPFLNKGTAFSAQERQAFGLEGLLPDHVSTMEEQVERAYAHVGRKEDDLERYIGLVALQDRNEHLFYRLLEERVEELLPIVYTPTVGRAAQRFSHIFRRARGVWINPEHRGRIASVLTNAPVREASLVVVTDNERILGLGDQGAGGMAIPTGKLALYTLGAGIHPRRTLPVSLDVGTDNEELLEDPLYLGYRHPRLRGAAYDELVDEFVSAVKGSMPAALLQWEDFKKANAIRLLERYRGELLSFNDDVQGTAAVALAGLLAAVRATERPLEEHRVLILGAGAAGTGIAHQLRDAFGRSGLEPAEVTRRVAVLDSRGLLSEERDFRSGDGYKRRFAWPRELVEAVGADPEGDLLAQVEALHPTVLVGTSGQPGIFSRDVVEAMAARTRRPVIFPLSNPTSRAEATPRDLLEWTGGRALVATGSPFDPVELDGRTWRIGQGNNVLVFPGVGLGALAAGAREVTDGMFTMAAETLAEAVGQDDLEAGSLFPRLRDLQEISRRVALAVALEAARAGAAEVCEEEALRARIEERIWRPRYPRLQPS